ncbi:MAG TPA: hypothetical protein VG964_02910 [Candidatus Saccharimonadales bacterium]|nr:hypothetical protein [Candidatus Saccharimonadales bacterium]
MSKAAIDELIKRQAEIFCHYLTGRRVTDKAVRDFSEAMARTASTLSSHDEKLVRFAVKHPWSVGYLDGALALVEPEAELRRRLYFMFSILEASPDYHAEFLPQRRSPSYIFIIAVAGVRSVIRALAGMILVKVVG